MTHAEFRRKQAAMDEAGLITCIKAIRLSKVKAKDIIADQHLVKTIYRYKYRYEVILNGQIVKQTKSRRTAKNYLIEVYDAQIEYNKVSSELNVLTERLKRKGIFKK